MHAARFASLGLLVPPPRCTHNPARPRTLSWGPPDEVTRRLPEEFSWRVEAIGRGEAERQ